MCATGSPDEPSGPAFDESANAAPMSSSRALATSPFSCCRLLSERRCAHSCKSLCWNPMIESACIASSVALNGVQTARLIVGYWQMKSSKLCNVRSVAVDENPVERTPNRGPCSGSNFRAYSGKCSIGSTICATKESSFVHASSSSWWASCSGCSVM